MICRLLRLVSWQVLIVPFVLVLWLIVQWSIASNQATIANIRIMVESSLSFFKVFGPVTADGFTMEGAYTATITTGDGDFLTKNTL